MQIQTTNTMIIPIVSINDFFHYHSPLMPQGFGSHHAKNKKRHQSPPYHLAVSSALIAHIIIPFPYKTQESRIIDS